MIKISNYLIVINGTEYSVEAIKKIKRMFHHNWDFTGDKLTGLEDLELEWLDKNLVKLNYKAEVPTDDIEVDIK